MGRDAAHPRGQVQGGHVCLALVARGTDPEEFATKERFPQMREPHFDSENNFLWIDSIVGGTIPGNFMPAVEKGFRDRMGRGVIAGYKVQNICVEVFFGKIRLIDNGRL